MAVWLYANDINHMIMKLLPLNDDATRDDNDDIMSLRSKDDDDDDDDDDDEDDDDNVRRARGLAHLSGLGASAVPTVRASTSPAVPAS